MAISANKVIEGAFEPHAEHDYFVERNGVKFAGSHLLLDLWGAKNLDDPAFIEMIFRKAIDACGATLLHIHMHHFSPYGGVSGVAVLAESHISIHTWPERNFAAIDIFMCGACDPYNAVPVLKEAFQAETFTMNEAKRGLVP